MASFATAMFALERGHKVKRKHWTGYWKKEGNEVVMHTYDGRELNVRESEDIMYTLSQCACDDWEIADNYGASRELGKEERNTCHSEKL